MQINQSIVNQPSADIVATCLNAIETSIEHFTKIRKHIKKLAASLQENNEAELEITPSNLKQAKNLEPLCISKVNYIAVLALENLGIQSPSQQQIDTMESIILLSMNANELDREKIELYIGNETIAKRIFLRQLRNICQ